VKRYILDSGIVSDLVDRRNGVDLRAAEAFRQGGRLGIGTPVLGELLAGLYNSSSRAKNIQKLERSMARLVLWPYDEAAAREYERVAGELRRRGIAIQQIDMQIAAIAIALGNAVVVTKDSDFAAIAGLEVENWAAG
jgi:tRNA(fMet)-specific endonuclease VapC